MPHIVFVFMERKVETVVITGSAGLIGSHLSYRLLSLGYKVVGIDSLIGGYKSNMPISSNFNPFQTDILNREEIFSIFRTYKPKYVFHCAALAHEGLSVSSPKTIVENIYAGTASIMSASCAFDVKLFINTSSMARYGSGNPPFRESDRVNPIDPYGLAKVHAEQHLQLMSDIYGIKVITVVPHNVCGPHQCYSDPFRNVMSIFANQLKRDKSIYIYGDGSQKRSFSHVQDCIDAFVRIVERQDLIKNGEIFNIGPSDGTEITVLDLAYKVARQFNKEPIIEFLPERPREVKHAWVSTDKARAQLDYETNLSLDDIVSDTISWIKKQPDREFNYHLPIEIVKPTTPKTWTHRLFNR
jgi:UDP-glucose 4-epimerase